jgi:hypothetical protein
LQYQIRLPTAHGCCWFATFVCTNLNSKISWSLFPRGEQWSIVSIIPFSLVTARSSKLGVFSFLYLVGCWDTLLKTGSIDNVWDRFVDKLSIACKDNVPVYKSKPKHYDTPWMDKETLVTVQNKRKKWKKYIFSHH